MPRYLLTCEAGVRCLKASILGLSLLLAPMSGLALAEDANAPQAPAQTAGSSPPPADTSPADASAPQAAAADNAGSADQKSEAPVAVVPPSTLPHNLSPWGMFLSADVIVKIVMVGLAFASVVTWTVWLAKSIELFAARGRAARQLGILAEARNLQEAERSLQGAKGAVTRMTAAVIGELQRSADLAQTGISESAKEGIKERAAALVARIEARAGRQMNRGTGVLATIGATAPFVGLFGTVWGIMNSFIGISKTNTTNLAVVAPGIAEALLATAIGLVAAIPAVMIYNVFARSISSYRAVLGDAAAEILRHLSRDLDRIAQKEAKEDWHVRSMRQSAE